MCRLFDHHLLAIDDVHTLVERLDVVAHILTVDGEDASLTLLIGIHRADAYGAHIAMVGAVSPRRLSGLEGDLVEVGSLEAYHYLINLAGIEVIERDDEALVRGTVRS